MKNKIKVDGVTYVPEKQAETSKDYVIARTENAGVFAGYLKKREGNEITLTNARRIWYWEGAASLSQLAMEGTKKPDECKFPCPVAEVTLLELIELLPCTEQARKSIEGVPVWKA